MFVRKKHLLLIKRLNHKWVMPQGYDTGVKVFNCVTKNKQPLIVKNKNFVTWYTCGPTVYDSSHIGHASCFLKLDIIQRILKRHFNLNLVTVMNITDVDDKIITKSNELKVPVQNVAQQFEKEFWEDLDSLKIRRPDCVLRVTDNMQTIIKFIQKLVDSKKAYKADDNSIYFDVQNYDNYGKLQNISEETEESAPFKKSPMDFALWKANKPGEISWDSPWGSGRPGWHIECSAIASHVFGSEVDIHVGGIDLRFPHHENEEAQSCSFYEKAQWVNYWLHTGHLYMKGSEKMSKSLKNTISISSMVNKTPVDVFRMACVMSHYRHNMEFSAEYMATATNLLKNYKNFLDNCNNYSNGYIKADINDDAIIKLIVESSNKLHDALADDFNTPRVVKVLNEIISTVNSVLHASVTSQNDHKTVTIPAVSNLVITTLDMFGINIDKKDLVMSEDKNLTEVMNILNNFRQDIRQLGIANKDKHILELCDNVRDNLKKYGIAIKDHGKLSSWSTG